MSRFVFKLPAVSILEQPEGHDEGTCFAHDQLIGHVHSYELYLNHTSPIHAASLLGIPYSPHRLQYLLDYVGIKKGKCWELGKVPHDRARLALLALQKLTKVHAL